MADETAAEYKTSLEDLTFNSKPVINMLTMVAEENIDHAEQIVRVIEERLHKAHPSQKLPVLYLIDSILKNIKNSTYHDLFKTSIVTLFAAVFEKVDEKTRQAMYKLRQTWTEIFDNKILYSLDRKISQIDPAWPITAKPPEVPVTIHVNPKFLTKKSASPDVNEKKQRTPSTPNEAGLHQSAVSQEVPVQPEENKTDKVEGEPEDDEAQAVIREQLLSKQQELIRIQQEKLELELMEARAKLEQQTRQLQAREQQMRMQLLQQLKQNESGVSVEVKKEAEPKPKIRDPRLSRDPRISNRDPRSLPTSNTGSIESKNDSKNEKLKKQQPCKEAKGTAAKQSPKTQSQPQGDVKGSVQHVKQAEQTETSVSKKRTAEQLIDVKKDIRKKSSTREDMKNKKEEKKKSSILKSKELVEKVTKAGRVKKEIKDQGKELDSKAEMEHTRKIPHMHGSSTSPDKTTEVRQGKCVPQERSRPDSREGQPRSHSPLARNSKFRDVRHPENNNDRATHSSRRDPRGSSSSIHKRTFDRSSRIADKKPIHHGARHIAVKKRRDTSPPKRRHEESPPKKRIRQGSNKNDAEEDRLGNEDQSSSEAERDGEKLGGDLVDLFGKEDKDYRRLPPIPKINVTQQQSEDADSDTMLSPRSAGWSKFKASRPEHFPFVQPRSTAVLQRQESVDQFSSPLQSPPTEYHGYRTPRVRKQLLHDPEGISPDQAGDILKLAEDQLRHGRLTPDQHRELVNQLTELHKLQRLKQQIREEKMKISETCIIPASMQDTAESMVPFTEAEDKFPIGHQLPIGGKLHRMRAPRIQHPVLQPRLHPYRPGVRRRGPLLPTPRIEGDDHPPGPKGHPRPIRGPLLPTPDEPMIDLPEAKPDYELPLHTLLPPDDEPSNMRDVPLVVSVADDHVLARDQLNLSPENQGILSNADVMAPDGERDILEYRQHISRPSKPLLGDPGIRSGRPRALRPPAPSIRPVYGPTRPLSKQFDIPRPRVPRPRRMSGITDDSLVGPDHLNDPENTFEPLALPWYDTERFYCPEHDARWLKRATFVERDKSLYLNINNSKIQLPPHNKSREIYNMMTKLVIRFNESERKLYINNEEVYTVGELPRMYYYNSKHFEVSIFGPPQSIWLDNVQYQLHEDAPPEPITLGENIYHFQIDSRKNMVIADGHDICPAGGAPKIIQLNYIAHEIRFDPPPRHILLDGKLCELNLKAKFPYLVIDGKPRGVRFDGSPRQIIIDTVPYMVALDKPRKARVLGPRPRLLAFGGPGHEVIIDDMWYEVKFGAPPKEIKVGARTVHIELRGMPPEVKVLGEFVPLNHITTRVGYPPGPDLAAMLPNYVTPGSGDGGVGVAGDSQAVANKQSLPVTLGTDVQTTSSQVAQGTQAMIAGLTPYQTSTGTDSISQQPTTGQLQQPLGQQQVMAPLNVSDLLTRLLKAGIIQQQGSPNDNSKANSDDESQMVQRESVEEIPSLTDFIPSKLKKQYSGAIQLLSVGIQCASCGLRFVPEQKEKYREHLDWHFRQNKRGKDQMNMPKHRDWYYAVTEWIQYEEIGDLEKRSQSSFFEQVFETNSMPQSQGTRIVPGQVASCPAVEGGDDMCAVCGEVFEQFWDEDEEEWHLRDAVRAEDGKTYHPVCYEDVNESNTSMEESPSAGGADVAEPVPSADTDTNQVAPELTDTETSSGPSTSALPPETSSDQPVAKSGSVTSEASTVESQETNYNKKLLDMVNNPLAYIASLTKQMCPSSSQPNLSALEEASDTNNSVVVTSSMMSTAVDVSASLAQPDVTSATTVVSTATDSQIKPVSEETVGSNEEVGQDGTAQLSTTKSISIYSASTTSGLVPMGHPSIPLSETTATTNAQGDTLVADLPIAGTPLPTVPSHTSLNCSPQASSDPHSDGGTPVRDELLVSAGGCTPVYDEPGVESGRGTPVEDEPVDDQSGMQPAFGAGSPVIHIITPITSHDLEEMNIKQEP